MNRSMLVLLLFQIIIISSCKKSCDDPRSLNFEQEEDCVYADTTQRGLFIKVTGTWCAPCGSYGANKMKSTLGKYPNMIGMEVHVRDVMSNPIGNAMKSYLKSSAVPSFFANGKSRNISTALNQNFEVGLHLSWEKTDKQISVKSFIQPQEELLGDYYLAIYLMEDGHIAAQRAKDHSAHPGWEYSNGTYPKYQHTNILRGEASNNLFGRPISESGKLNQEIKQFDDLINIDFDPMGKVYPVLAIWEKDNANFNLVNIISGK